MVSDSVLCPSVELTLRFVLAEGAAVGGGFDSSENYTDCYAVEVMNSNKID